VGIYGEKDRGGALKMVANGARFDIEQRSTAPYELTYHQADGKGPDIPDFDTRTRRRAALDVRDDTNNDVFHVAVRPKGAQAWTWTPVMNFTCATVAELWAGRLAPSRHNTSAPDMIFRGYSVAGR
jgi:hypothetical protein